MLPKEPPKIEKYGKRKKLNYKLPIILGIAIVVFLFLFLFLNSLSKPEINDTAELYSMITIFVMVSITIFLLAEIINFLRRR